VVDVADVPVDEVSVADVSVADDSVTEVAVAVVAVAKPNKEATVIKAIFFNIILETVLLRLENDRSMRSKQQKYSNIYI